LRWSSTEQLGTPATDITILVSSQGRIQGAHPARAPPKIGKNMIFWRKIVIFHTKYPKNVHASLRNWKKYDFLA
jgi:hypothetical protein